MRWHPRTGEYDVRRIVPTHDESNEHNTPLISRVMPAWAKSRAALIALATVAVLAVAGTTFGYAALSKSVTLSLDGKSEQVTAMGGTVGDVLDSQGIDLGPHDIVAPGVDEKVSDGSRITVRFGRPLKLDVDGNKQTYWVTSTKVADALGEIGRRFTGAELSTSRGGSIDREGLKLDVVTPKTLTVKIGAKKPVKRTVTALTVEDALKDLHVNGESIGYDTVNKDDSSMLEGHSKVVRSGSEGLRNVTYRLVYRNGELAVRKVLDSQVTRAPKAEIVRVGTKQP